jgi:hypothetical protein
VLPPNPPEHGRVIADQQVTALFMRASLFKKLNVEPDDETSVIASLLTFNWFHLQVHESLSAFVYTASAGPEKPAVSLYLCDFIAPPPLPRTCSENIITSTRKQMLPSARVSETHPTVGFVALL